MPTYKTNYTYRNWARTQEFKPARLSEPQTESEVVEVVQDALAKGHHIRPHGGGHSWSDLIVTDSTLIQLDRLKAGQADLPNRRYTVQAGIRLKDLIRKLAEQGLALRNLGSITEQSIAGAISTGTHGTGLRLQNMSQSIISMKLVTGTGELLSIQETDTDLLDAARVSLGALGIITEVTIDCVPLYDLEYTAFFGQFDDVIGQIETLNEENERFLIWWLIPPFGSRENVIVITMNPTGAPRGSSEEWPISGEDGIHEPLPMDTNDLFGRLVSRTFSPRALQQVIRYTDRYDKVLTLPLLPVFHREFEYAIPVEKTSEALLRLKHVIDEGDISTTLPIEVRFVAKDNSLLSPARGRDVCYIGVSTQPNANEVYARVEPIMKDLEGRPHWGKHFSLRRSEVEAMYPDSYDIFRQLRQELD
ncbi:MAG TPA: D-arabinono-1,4-lactone oxidase, partial [Acidobacteriota bacterium]|nr:D-arabinono-1,4-lactone oxidase [Acidobacteriota bacterium]